MFYDIYDIIYMIWKKNPIVCISSAIFMIPATQPSAAAAHEVFASSLKICSVFCLIDF